jgi:hypothetical protein
MKGTTAGEEQRRVMVQQRVVVQQRVMARQWVIEYRSTGKDIGINETMGSAGQVTVNWIFSSEPASIQNIKRSNQHNVKELL